MSDTTIFGVYDHGIYGALENRSSESRADSIKPRQVNWRIYAKRSILCAALLSAQLLLETMIAQELCLLER